MLFNFVTLCKICAELNAASKRTACSAFAFLGGFASLVNHAAGMMNEREAALAASVGIRNGFRIVMPSAGLPE